MLLQPRDEGSQDDISDGEVFPRWLLVGGTGRVWPFLDRGVLRVDASGRSLVLTWLGGEVVLSGKRHQRSEFDEVSLA